MVRCDAERDAEVRSGRKRHLSVHSFLSRASRLSTRGLLSQAASLHRRAAALSAPFTPATVHLETSVTSAAFQFITSHRISAARCLADAVAPRRTRAAPTRARPRSPRPQTRCDKAIRDRLDPGTSGHALGYQAPPVYA